MANKDFPNGGVAIVTGGSGGIGGAIVERFAEAGSDVVFTYRKGKERADAVIERCRPYGVKVEALQVSLDKPEEIDAMLEGVVASGRKVHSFVYASGPTVNVGFVSDLKVEDVRFIFEHDLVACFSFTKAAINFLKKYPVAEKAAGSITAITSSQKYRPETRGVLSAAPKAAVEALYYAAAKENARFGIRINIVQSGWVMAGQISDGIDGQLNEAALASIVKQIPVGRLGSPYEVAEGVLFTSSARSSFLTGASIVIDGGMHL